MFFILLFSGRRGRESGYLEVSEDINCEGESSALLIADAWRSLKHENIPRALACSRKVISEYSYEANAQQRELGSNIPTNREMYPVLNDVGTAWLIQGEAMYAITDVRPLRDYEKRYAQAAYQFAMSRYPSAYALYESGGYWPVRQAAFCHSYQHFSDQSARLPAVYTDLYAFSNCYAPSGFMPSKEHHDTTVDPGWRKHPHSGETCLRVVYSAVSGEWEGVYLQYPPNNWGDEKGLDLTRASALTFWARGGNGEKVAVEFKIGGICPDGAKYCDSLEFSLGTVTLESEWRQYTMDLSKLDSSSIIGGFAWVITAANNPNGATFYLDDILFVEGGTQ